MNRSQKLHKDLDEGMDTLAITLWDAMNDLVDLECPDCHEYLDLPSLEDIREWLKEEK